VRSPLSLISLGACASLSELMAEHAKPANLLRRRHWWSDFFTPETPRRRVTLAAVATLLGSWGLLFKAYGLAVIMGSVLVGCLVRETWYRRRGKNVDGA
jgi:hypothetical protein